MQIGMFDILICINWIMKTMMGMVVGIMGFSTAQGSSAHTQCVLKVYMIKWGKHLNKHLAQITSRRSLIIHSSDPLSMHLLLPSLAHV